MTPRRPTPLALLLPLAFLPLGCVDDGSGDDLPEPAEDADPRVVPTDPEALLAWLVAEPYLDWPGESAIHASTGPHFGNVRTWIHPELEPSLQAGAAEHPASSATVKELYGSGQERRGWSVSVKTTEGAGEDGWYWYEWYDGEVLASGQGISACTGCHGGGTDFVLTPFPLQ